VRVARAQLGPTVQVHAASAIVNSVLWPSQSDPRRPGRRYNFRVAAYNNAGFSNFAYFEMKLYSVAPRVLPAAGGTIIEILLVGGGVTADGYTVWVGRLANDGNIDKQKSKVCASLVSLDLAGTRMKCKSPSWVGGQFDLIVHYKSGVFEQIAVGSGWMKYQSPEIRSLSPATFDPATPKVPITVTIAGKNFGLDARDLFGELVGATLIPCRPLVVITDSTLQCTLTPLTPRTSWLEILSSQLVMRPSTVCFLVAFEYVSVSYVTGLFTCVTLQFVVGTGRNVYVCMYIYIYICICIYVYL